MHGGLLGAQGFKCLRVGLRGNHAVKLAELLAVLLLRHTGDGSSHGHVAVALYAVLHLGVALQGGGFGSVPVSVPLLAQDARYRLGQARQHAVVEGGKLLRVLVGQRQHGAVHVLRVGYALPGLLRYGVKQRLHRGQIVHHRLLGEESCASHLLVIYTFGSLARVIVITHAVQGFFLYRSIISIRRSLICSGVGLLSHMYRIISSINSCLSFSSRKVPAKAFPLTSESANNPSSAFCSGERLESHVLVLSSDFIDEFFISFYGHCCHYLKITFFVYVGAKIIIICSKHMATLRFIRVSLYNG